MTLADDEAKHIAINDARLAEQLLHLLRDRTMTCDQLASCYSIKYGESLTKKLKDNKQQLPETSLATFLARHNDIFLLGRDNSVRAAPSIPGIPIGSANLTMKYADVSRNIQALFVDGDRRIPSLNVEEIDVRFKQRYNITIAHVVGSSTEEYVCKKGTVFSFDEATKRVTRITDRTRDTRPSLDEAHALQELVSLLEQNGPVCDISTLCVKFLEQTVVSVTSIIRSRPIDLFKQHGDVFLMIGAASVALQRHKSHPDVIKAIAEAKLPVTREDLEPTPLPEAVTDDVIVKEFVALIQAEESQSAYISRLCGRFLQMFRKPVTAFIDCKPADFIRRYPNTFVMLGAGNVGLHESQKARSPKSSAPSEIPSLADRREIKADAKPSENLRSTLFSLHNKVAPPGKCQKFQELAQGLADRIRDSSFLSFEKVCIAGSFGADIVVPDVSTLHLVFFIEQLPCCNFSQWHPQILLTLEAI
eukprot:GEMP01018091.1.p1 GENE.GEMP01018091.1~~GEMP01018091.1.p1  ORF type:complete len:475 (+),score=76.00 GEMP01018091.1:457-1881(+)